MKTPLYTAIQKYISKNPSRFHMPAHFGVGDFTDLYKSAPYDVTELEFSDNLVNPSGVIAEAEKLAAKYYQSKKAMYFTSGATVALLTAIGAAGERGDTIIMERGCHRAVYAAAALFGYKPYYILPEFNEFGIALPVSRQKVSEAMAANPKAAAVVITSPNYFGFSADTAIAEDVKAAGLKLIVDEAHGAHFAFSDLLPKSFSGLADFCVESLHKTLPVYTGGAILNVNDISLVERAKATSLLVNTSSPSYLTMASMDYALAVFNECGEGMYAKLFDRIKAFKLSLKQFEFLPSDDFTRVSIKCGAEVVKSLNKFDVYPEMTYGNYAVFIVSPYNADRLDLLQSLLNNMQPKLDVEKNYGFDIMPINGKDGKRKVFLPLDEAVGKTAFAEIGFYPPGIPLVARGEVITDEILSIFKINANCDKFGFISGKVCVTI